MYDLIILGAGPAGLTAGIYAVRRAMKTLILSSDVGGQLNLASDIENYPGFAQIDSFDLIKKMEEHAKSAGAEIKIQTINEIKKENEVFKLYGGQEIFEAKTVIVAMGLSPRLLAIKGENELSGRGISYCANCDGPLYRNKVVAVLGGGNSALDAAEYLSKIASQVYLIHRNSDFRGFEGLVNEVKKRENIQIYLETEVREIIGAEKVEALKLFNNNTQNEKELLVNGVFVEIGRVAHTDLVVDLADRNDKKQIIVDEYCQTKTEGLFAAGDITNVPFKQITIACGQGTIAALAAYQYLQAKTGGKGIISDRSKVRM